MSKICTVPGCAKFEQAKGLCVRHYKRMSRYGSVDLPPRLPSTKTCTVPRCDRPHVANGLCNNHYQRQWQRQRRQAESDDQPKESNR